MAIFIRTVSNTLYINDQSIVSNRTTLPIYGSLVDSNNYFAMLLHGQKWEYLSSDLKVKALVSATKLIENLNFAGSKANASQPLQFPRGTDTLVPVAIEEATYELALALLKGIDPDTERDNLSVTVQAYGSLRSEFNRSSPPPYIVAGIPSATAWNKLLPFLEPRTAVTLSRIN